MTTPMSISQLARRSGVPATTLRFYEKAGVLPPPPRSPAGYRRYDEVALARVRFLQRARALGIELDDVAELVQLWDGNRCEPVQDRLRERVHERRQETRRRLEELTQLAADLDRVGATIGSTDACGPDCACLSVSPAIDPANESLPTVRDGLIGACCTLDSAAIPERLAAWKQLRERSTSVDEMHGGIRLGLPADERLDRIIGLVAAESECCSFYRFTITVDGGGRWLEVDAGPDGAPAVRALLGVDR